MHEDKYSHDQQREAVRAAKARRAAGGGVKDLPLWMQEANREYYARYELNRVRSPRTVNRSVLPEDGIIDWLAIELVATGQRVVDLTSAERTLAVARMERAGLRPVEMANRLGIHHRRIAGIVFKIRHNDAEQKILNAIENEKYEVTAA